MLSCRSSGVWARGVWRYHRTRTLPLPPGTPRSGQLDLWHILQTASPHMLLPGKEIKKKKRSVSPGSRDGNPALLLLAQVGNSPNSVTLGLFLPGKPWWKCSLCGHPSPGGCHAEKLKSAGTSGWILVSKGDFTGWLFACPLLSPPGIIATEQQINYFAFFPFGI